LSLLLGLGPLRANIQPLMNVSNCLRLAISVAWAALARGLLVGEDVAAVSGLHSFDTLSGNAGAESALDNKARLPPTRPGGSQGHDAKEMDDRFAHLTSLQQVKEQAELTSNIIGRYVAAKKISKDMADLFDTESAKTATKKRKAEVQFCDLEAQLRKTVTLHRIAKHKQHAAIKQVAKTVNFARKVMEAFEKTKKTAKKTAKEALTKAKKAHDANSKSKKDTGDKADSMCESKCEEEEQEAFTEAKQMKAWLEQENDARNEVVEKISKVLSTPDKMCKGAKK